MRVWIRLKRQAEAGQNGPDRLTVRMHLPQAPARSRGAIMAATSPRGLLQEKDAMGLLVNLEDINYKVFVCV